MYYYSVGIRYQFFGENLTRKRESPLSLHRIAGSVREKIDAIYRHILSDTEYALLKAIFLGDKTDLSKEQKHLYEENGMAHLLAVSGLHVSIVGGMLFRFLRKKGRSYAFSCIVGSGIYFLCGYDGIWQFRFPSCSHVFFAFCWHNIWCRNMI